MSGTKYRTIVADPPWAYERPYPSANPHRPGSIDTPLPYASLRVAEIEGLPVASLVQNARLFLWVTHEHLRYVWGVSESWGFAPRRLCVWTKAPKGTAQITTEFFLIATKGKVGAFPWLGSNWFHWPRSSHSSKPDAFYDLVEQVSPGPYLELFARRQRLGWDTWGNEALEHVDLSA